MMQNEPVLGGNMKRKNAVSFARPNPVFRAESVGRAGVGVVLQS